MKLNLKYLFVFCYVSFSFLALSAPKEKALEIILGIDKTIKLDFRMSTKFQIGNESILAIQGIPQKKEITFKGLKAGYTNATIRDVTGEQRMIYNITVKATDQSKIVQELREFLGDIEGLDIGIKGKSVFVGGKIVVPSDIGRVVVVLDRYPDVVRLVELSPQTQRIIGQKMQSEIQKNNMKDVSVRIVNKRFWLEGIVGSKGQADFAFKIASAYIPENIQSLAQRSGETQEVNLGIIQNFISINEKKKAPPVPKLIKIAAQFVELTRDYQKVFGFKWEPTLGGSGGEIKFGKSTSGGLTTKSNSTLSGTIANLFPKLASAKSAGFARVIQSGVLVIKEGKKGSLQKNSEKPYQIGTGEFVKAEKANAGFNLGVTPSILGGEKINLKINVGVSASIGNPPETLSNNIDTELIVKSKESAVVGGVVVSKSSTSYDKTPPDGQSEVADGTRLFSFLKSKDYFSTRSQFVVFITPEIIDSASTGTDKIKRKFRRRYR